MSLELRLGLAAALALKGKNVLNRKYNSVVVNRTILGVTPAELLPPRTQQKQNPRDIARGVFVRSNADRLRGPLPALAEQAQCAEAGGEERKRGGERNRRRRGP